MHTPQCKALNLLKSFLDSSQLTELRSRGEFYLTTPRGSTYRLDARRGRTERVTRHGRRWFVLVRFCLHDDHEKPDEVMPPADLTLTHMLLLQSDEDTFLGLANATIARDMLWNGDWLRRLRQARAERAAHSAALSGTPDPSTSLAQVQ